MSRCLSRVCLRTRQNHGFSMVLAIFLPVVSSITTISLGERDSDADPGRGFFSPPHRFHPPHCFTRPCSLFTSKLRGRVRAWFIVTNTWASSLSPEIKNTVRRAWRRVGFQQSLPCWIRTYENPCLSVQLEWLNTLRGTIYCLKIPH